MRRVRIVRSNCLTNKTPRRISNSSQGCGEEDVKMSKQEIRVRIAELAKIEAEAIAEGDRARFRDMRGRRNALEALL